MATPESAVRASPPTERVVAVLDFLARHPNARFGLSELARRLELSKPTCLGIVNTLTSAGYLVRDGSDKTYRLGPALIALGRTAQEALRIGPTARAELARLSSRHHAIAGLSAVVDDRITLLEIDVPRGVKAGVRVGQSYPFTPPVGLMFVLWDDGALRDWLSRPATVAPPADNDRLHRVIAECRSTGYLVERLTPAGRRLYTMMAGVSSALPDELRMLLGELVADIGERVQLRDEPGPTHVSVISAPVYDEHGHQVMVASLHVGDTLTDEEITFRATDLVVSADAVTAELGGRKPTW